MSSCRPNTAVPTGSGEFKASDPDLLFRQLRRQPHLARSKVGEGSDGPRIDSVERPVGLEALPGPGECRKRTEVPGNRLASRERRLEGGFELSVVGDARHQRDDPLVHIIPARSSPRGEVRLVRTGLESCLCSHRRRHLNDDPYRRVRATTELGQRRPGWLDRAVPIGPRGKQPGLVGRNRLAAYTMELREPETDPG